MRAEGPVGIVLGETDRRPESDQGDGREKAYGFGVDGGGGKDHKRRQLDGRAGDNGQLAAATEARDDAQDEADGLDDKARGLEGEQDAAESRRVDRPGEDLPARQLETVRRRGDAQRRAWRQRAGWRGRRGPARRATIGPEGPCQTRCSSSARPLLSERHALDGPAGLREDLDQEAEDEGDGRGDLTRQPSPSSREEAHPGPDGDDDVHNEREKEQDGKQDRQRLERRAAGSSATTRAEQATH